MLQVGIVGAGGMGNVHARQYRKMADVGLTFFDRSTERTTEFAKSWDCRPSQSIESLISEVDIVDICLPTDLHLEIALIAIASGRAVFVEKPITRTLEEARTLRDAADRAGVPVMPGQVVRYFPEFRLGSEIVKRGDIGVPAAARTRRGGRAPSGSQGWFLDHARSGGVLVDLAIHDFDWLRWTLGEVKTVYSRSVAIETGSGPDYACTTLSFQNGAVAHVESTWMDPAGFRTCFEVAGSAGLIQFDSKSNVALQTVRMGSGGDSAVTTSCETPGAPTDDPYFCELKAFLDCVVTKTPVPVTPEDGLRALSIALAAVESAKTRRVITPEQG